MGGGAGGASGGGGAKTGRGKWDGVVTKGDDGALLFEEGVLSHCRVHGVVGCEVGDGGGEGLDEVAVCGVKFGLFEVGVNEEGVTFMNRVVVEVLDPVLHGSFPHGEGGCSWGRGGVWIGRGGGGGDGVSAREGEDFGE